MRLSTLAIFTAAAAVNSAAAQGAETYTVIGGVTSAQTTFTTTRTVYRVDQTVTATRSHSWSSTAESSWATSTTESPWVTSKSQSPFTSSVWSTVSASSASAAWPTAYTNGTASQSSAASSGSLPTASSTMPVSGASSLRTNSLSFAAVAGLIGYNFT